MLQGRNDVEWISYFNSNMRKFSDDGIIFHGAYGFRWRQHFSFDQIERVISLLKNNPNSRRAVIQMWDCVVDLYKKEEQAPKDLPCNDLIFLQILDGKLDMSVICRSQDIIWGAYGANSVHFSILQEYIAGMLGIRMGLLYQFSNNYHAYVDIFEKNCSLIDMARDPYRTISYCPYTRDEVYVKSLVDDASAFDLELNDFVEGNKIIQRSNSIFEILTSIQDAYICWKEDKDYEKAYEHLQSIPLEGNKSLDWVRACTEWLARRQHLVCEQERGRER